jgi:hypothetical protein
MAAATVERAQPAASAIVSYEGKANPCGPWKRQRRLWSTSSAARVMTPLCRPAALWRAKQRARCMILTLLSRSMGWGRPRPNCFSRLRIDSPSVVMTAEGARTISDKAPPWPKKGLVSDRIFGDYRVLTPRYSPVLPDAARPQGGFCVFWASKAPQNQRESRA